MNPNEIKAAIYAVLNTESKVSSRLDMLTAIFLTTTSKEVRKITEEIRDEICAGTDQEQGDQKSNQLDLAY